MTGTGNGPMEILSRLNPIGTRGSQKEANIVSTLITGQDFGIIKIAIIGEENTVLLARYMKHLFHTKYLSGSVFSLRLIKES